MGTDTDESEGREAGEQPRLGVVRVGGWPGLGGDVRFSLERRRTILVGRNSAGKSLLVEGLTRAALAAVGMQHPRQAPLSFYCEVEVQGTGIAYEYHAHGNDTDDEAEGTVDEPLRWSWQERCWQLADGRELWRVDGSKLVIGGGSPLPFAPSRPACRAARGCDARSWPQGPTRRGNGGGA